MTHPSDSIAPPPADRAAVERGVRPAPVWRGAAVAVVAAVASVLIWLSLMENEARQGERIAAAISDGIRNEIEDGIGRRLEALRNVAAFWSRFGGVSRAGWEIDARLLIQQYPGLVSIGWVDSRSGDRWVEVREVHAGAGIELDAESRERVEDAEAQARATQHELMVGPLTAVGGEPAFSVLIPVADATARTTPRDPVAGVVEAIFLARPSLESMVMDTLGVHVARVEWGGHTLYRSAAASDNGHGWSRAALVELPDRTRWSLHVSPSRVAMQARESLAYPVLAFGLTLSLALGALVYFARLASRRAELMELENEALNRQAQEIARAREAMRRFNAELEQRVRDRTSELEAAVSDLEAFSYSVSHDLRSPLGAILNFAAIIEEDYGERLDAEGQEFLERISTSASSAMGMMEGLLAFSRLGRQEMKRRPTDLERLAADCVHEAVAGEARTPRVEFDFGPHTAANVDPSMMRLVFANLIKNAVKFSRESKEPHIEIGAEELGGEVRYFVRDNGVGFDPRYAERLFGVFERLHSEQQYRGAGVGLAIAARIVRRHGGSIHAESVPGEGATFSFTVGTEDGRRHGSAEAS